MEGATRQKWSLSEEAFNALLAALDSQRDDAADKYLELRRNLVRLFEWRGCSTPEEYADETINRCAKKIGEGEAIRDVATYSIGIARMLLLEKRRENAREAISLNDAPEPGIRPSESQTDEARVECLRGCVSQLSQENRELILQYYQGEKGEKIKKSQSPDETVLDSAEYPADASTASP